MPVIKVENLWKEYRLGVISHGTLTHDLQSWWARARGKVDPNSKIPMLKDQKKQIMGDRFWALKGINLEIDKGEVIGIIGKNGAGKSTLLKILSRVTAPTSGIIKVRGRIASLLEVGTGFHPELTGRENIFLNGAIFGMSKLETGKKLDEIIDFSGVEDFIDMPVKRYSSGMYVRLAFAVAAHLEPEILVVDEVLAVGDAEFQKKCLGKMGDVAKKGRTVLFVSHNMAAIRRLCKTGVVLKNGEIDFSGSATDSIDHYLKAFSMASESQKTWEIGRAPGDDNLKLISYNLYDCKNESKVNFRQNEDLFFDFVVRIFKQISLFRINLTVETNTSEIAFVLSSYQITKHPFREGQYCFSTKIPRAMLNARPYNLFLNIGIPNVRIILKQMLLTSINIEESYSYGPLSRENRPGVVAPNIEWKYRQYNL